MIRLNQLMRETRQLMHQTRLLVATSQEQRRVASYADHPLAGIRDITEQQLREFHELMESLA